jgi:hypothetical protein
MLILQHVLNAVFDCTRNTSFSAKFIAPKYMTLFYFQGNKNIVSFIIANNKVSTAEKKIIDQ